MAYASEMTGQKVDLLVWSSLLMRSYAHASLGIHTDLPKEEKFWWRRWRGQGYYEGS
jgi:hypothetical protein